MLLVLIAILGLVLPLAWAPLVQAADPCTPGANPIVCENSKPGSHWSEWEIDGAGDSSIQGFSTEMSVDAGETIDFKVDTDAADYDIDIYRTGWYQGLGARKVDSVEPSATLPQIQPECLWDQTTELTDCGTWGVSASWDVPADAVSGVYLAKLTRTDTGGASHITFVVRDDGSTSDVLFQTSDTTWHAYNTYGGSDFYQGANNGRAFKISYNRPYATRGGIEARDFFFGNEYPLVRFLERNGYDVSYFSGVDTDRYGEQLVNHKVFLSVGHDEYWSGRQRANVEAARDAGVHLQFLSGNEMYWRVRYEPSPADPSGDDHRTLVSYKETWSGQKIDPAQEWTGTFRDPRFASVANGAGVPENALTGTAYVVNYGDYPVTVDDREGDLRLWRNTGLEDLAAGSREPLAPHTVGYESNEDLLNGFRPPGLIRLSTTTGQVPEYLQDFGNTVAPGETTHHTTLYRAESGALVFSAGSVQWTWGLDEWHDGDGAPADPRMQQAQVNLLADMEAQPATLMDGLVPATASTDTTPPTVTVTDAPTGPVPHGERVTVSGTATDGAGAGAGRVAGVEYSLDGGETWLLADGYEDWTFTYVQPGMDDHTVLVRAIDDSANHPATGTPITTEVTGPYSAFGDLTPDTADTGDTSTVELGLRFTPTVDGVVTGVRFYRSQANTGSHTGTLWSLDGAPLATVTFPEGPASTEAGWRSAEFSQPVPVTAGTDYVVSYTAPAGRYAADPYYFAYRGVDGPPLTVAGGFGVPDAGVYGGAGSYPARSFQNANYYVDALFVPADDLPLGATLHVPADTAVSVPVSTPISTTLSRAVEPATVTATLTDVDGTAVPGTTDYDPATRLLTFTPAAPLAESTGYTVTVTAADTEGNVIESGAQWGFRTWSTTPADDCPCGLLDETYLPAQTSIDDGRPVTLGTRFVPTEAGVVTGIEFYRGTGTGTGQTGALFTGGGTLLAEVTFPSDSVSGWQYAALSEPVRLEPGSEYVVAYTTRQYSVSAGYWAPERSVGPLRVDGMSGLYSYGSPFPEAAVSTNFLVDVHFTPDLQAPRLLQNTPAGGSMDVPVDTSVTAVFGDPLHSEATLAVSAAGDPVSGTVQRSSDGTTLTWTPTAELPAGTLVSVTVSGAAATDSEAPETVPPLTWTFRTSSGQEASVQSFLGDAVPTTLDAGDSAAVELGVQLTTSKDITVQAIRFYRGTEPGANGTGTLWAADGTALAHVRFGPATGTGWQTALLDTPVQLTAGTTFTVSRHAPDGGYTYTPGAFADPITRGALTLAGTNGRFRYGTGGTAPTNTWGNTNYFVDLLYTEDVVAQVLSAGDRQPDDAAVSVPLDTTVSTVLSQAVDPATVDLTVAAAGSGADIVGTVGYEEGTRRVTFTPDAPLAEATRYTATVTAQDAGGADIATGAVWSFTTWSTTAADECPCGLLAETVLPTAHIDDNLPVTLGTLFSTTAPGVVEGLEAYRAPGNTSVQSGSLFTADGTELGRVEFGDGVSSGWQYAELADPVRLEPGAEYVVAYTTTAYSAVSGGWQQPTLSGPLQTPMDAGRYSYTDAFPDRVSSTNYLADLRFVPDADAPALVERSPAPGALEVDPATAVTAGFDQPVDGDATISLSAGTAEVPGALTQSADGSTFVFTPSEPLPAGAVITVTISGAVALGGTGTAPDHEWTFRTSSGQEASVQSFLGDAVPTTLDAGDPAAVELGVQLTTSKDITVQAIRFYRGTEPGANGTGTLWAADGTALAHVRFGPATGTGWQTALLDTPVQLTAGTTFTVSRHAPDGGYTYTPGAFADPITRGALTLAGTNGRFRYGTGGTAPTNTWGNTNYFVDLLYTALPIDEESG